MLEIEVINHAQSQIPTERIPLVLRQTLERHRVLRAQISVAIVDDATIQKLNRQFLDHDFATDVLTFPAEAPDRDGILSGEIIASAETAARFAVEWGTTEEAELLLYAVHGLLHLLGYDDHTPAAARRMRSAESESIQAAGFAYRFPEPGDLGFE